MTNKKKIFTLIFVLFSFTVCMAQKETIALKLETGKQYTQTTTSKSTITQEIEGKSLSMIMTIKGTMTYQVKAANAQGYDMEVMYKNLSMSMQLPQGSMEFSSEKSNENDILSSILAEMKDKPFAIKITRTGKVTEVKNIEALWESAIGKFPDLPEEQKNQIKEQLRKAYGEEAFKGSIERVTAIFPDKPVAVNDSWVIDTKLESGMSANVTSTYKLKEKTGDYLLMEGKSKIQTADKDAYITFNGVAMKYDLSGIMGSEIKVDRKSGWIIEARINQDIRGNTHIKGNEQFPEGMTIPMVMMNDIRVSGK